MAFGSDNKLTIELTVDSSGAINGFKQLDNAVQKTEDKAKGAAGAFDSFFAGLVQGGGIELARRGIDALVSSLGSIGPAIQRGSQIDDIASSFEKLSTQAGASSDALLNKFGNALGNTIPKVDLMKQANELLVGGLDPSKFELVAKAARTLGETTGTDAKDGLEKLGDSLLRGNDKALKNLGIVVDNNKAYEEFAKKLGTTADKLSEEGKVLATREAVLAALSAKQKELGDVTDDAGDKIDQMKASLQDQADEALRALANNKQLNDGLDELKKLVSEIDFKSLITDLANFAVTAGTLAVEAGRKLADTLSSISLGIQAVFVNGSTDELAKQVVGLKTYSDTISKLGQITNAIQFAKTTEEVDLLHKQFLLTAKGATEFGVSLGALKGQAAAFKTAEEAATKSITQFGKSVSDIKKPITDHNNLIIKNKDATKEQAKEQEKLKENFKILQKYMEDYNKEVTESIRNDDRYKDVMDQLKAGTISQSDATKTLNDVFKDNERIVNLARDAQYKFEQAMAAVRNNAPDATAKIEEMTKAYTELGIAQSAAASGSGGILGNFQKNLQGVLDTVGNVGADIVKAMFEGRTLKNADWAKYAGQISRSLADALFKDIPIVGPIIAEIADQATQAIVKFFGGKESAGTKARKAVRKFFGDIFDANELGIIVNGELVKLDRLVLNGTTIFGGNVSFDDTSFSKYLQSLPAQVQAAFNGVGDAFTLLVGDAEAALGQFGSIIANNIGGSLNNLQLLVEATGVSFEQLHDQVVKAFLDGKLSAAEAQAELIGIQKVAEKGIPDGLGLVKQAFDNMKAAGAKGGRALLDALQDIGYEAKELHLNTLPDLANYLVNVAGESKEEVDKLMAALAANGIKTIDDITKANAEKLIPVLAQLQNMDFPFSKASKEAKDLTDQVNGLPERKSVTVDIKANVSPGDRQVINATANIQGVGTSPGKSV